MLLQRGCCPRLVPADSKEEASDGHEAHSLGHSRECRCRAESAITGSRIERDRATNKALDQLDGGPTTATGLTFFMSNVSAKSLGNVIHHKDGQVVVGAIQCQS